MIRRAFVALAATLIPTLAYADLEAFSGFSTGGADDITTLVGSAVYSTDNPRTGLWHVRAQIAGGIPVAGEVPIVGFYGAGKRQCGLELRDGGGLALIFKSGPELGAFGVTSLPQKEYTAVELCNSVDGASINANCSMYTDGLLRATGAKVVNASDTEDFTEIRFGDLTAGDYAVRTYSSAAQDGCVRLYIYWNPSPAAGDELDFDESCFDDGYASAAPACGIGFVTEHFPDADGDQDHFTSTCGFLNCAAPNSHDASNEGGDVNTQRTDDPRDSDGEDTFVGNNANANEETYEVTDWGGTLPTGATVEALQVRAATCTNSSGPRCGRAVIFDADSTCADAGDCGAGAPNECVDGKCKHVLPWHFDGVDEGTDCNASPQDFEWFTEIEADDYESIAWNLTQLDAERWQFGYERSAASDCASDSGTGSRVRMSTLAIELLVREPDPIALENIPDLTGDGERTVAFGCDSIVHGSVAGTCSTDETVACGCQKICEWSLEKDVCCGVDANCDYCSDDALAQTRKLCIDETDCGACATNADCNGFACISGDCDCVTGSACVDACPSSGSCVVTEDFVALTCTDVAGIDNCLNCGDPGDATRELDNGNFLSAFGWLERMPDILACSSGLNCDDNSDASCRLIKGTWAEPDVVVSICGVNNEHTVTDPTCAFWFHDGQECPRNDDDLCEVDGDCTTKGGGSCTRAACVDNADCVNLGSVCEGDAKCHYGECSGYTTPNYTCEALTCKLDADCPLTSDLLGPTCVATCTGDRAINCISDAPCAGASAGTCDTSEKRCRCSTSPAARDAPHKVKCSVNTDCQGTHELAVVGICDSGACLYSGPPGCADPSDAWHDQRRQRHDKRPWQDIVSDTLAIRDLVEAPHPVSGNPRIFLHMTQPDIADICELQGWQGQVDRMRLADEAISEGLNHRVSLYEYFAVHDERTMTTRESLLRSDGIHPSGPGAAVMAAAATGYLQALRPACSGDLDRLCNYCSWDLDRDDDVDVLYPVGCADDAGCIGICLDVAGVDCEGGNCETAPRCSTDLDCTNDCSTGTCGQGAACTDVGAGTCSTFSVGLVCSNDLALACANNTDCDAGPGPAGYGVCAPRGWVWRYN